MTLSSIFVHQLIWVGLGLAYNGASALMIARGGAALAPTNPAAGAVFVLVVAAFVAAGVLGWTRVYKLALPGLSLALIAAGVLPHLLAVTGETGLNGYASPPAWAAALAINVYGAGVFGVATWAAYRRRV
ncbi:MAG: hypothetical protein RIA71_08070 [Oceanicaulis sp.]